MTINEALLITTNTLQEYLVDKDTGLPLAAGVITLFKDTERTVLKNWFVQSGTVSAYTYIPLPNPLTLSSVGTIVDVNGNDVLPFYFPFSELDNAQREAYFITIDDSSGERQYTRQNFPFSPVPGAGAQEPTLKNYITNPNFWRNIGSKDLTNVKDFVVAPSKHEGLSQPDWRFLKDVTGSADTLTFKRFSQGTPVITEANNRDIQPEYFLNHKCTSAGTETTKVYQVPVALHLAILDSVSATFKIQAQNVGGNINNTLDIFLLAFTGTAGTPVAEPILIKTFVINNEWTEHTVQFIFPSTIGKTLGIGGDDAMFIQIGLPTGKTCDINFTLPSIYLSDITPSNNVTTYSQTDSIVTTPRTGDLQWSSGNARLGWIAADDGTLGTTASGSSHTEGEQLWPLYQLYWDTMTEVIAPVSGGGRGSQTAIEGFTANKTLTMPRMLGRVLAGNNPNLGLNNGNAFTDYTLKGSPPTDTVNLTPLIFLTTGTPAIIGVSAGGAVPLPLVNDQIVFLIATATANEYKFAQTIEDAYAGTAITLTTAGSGTQRIFIPNGAEAGSTVNTIDTDNLPVITTEDDYVSNVAGSDVGLSGPANTRTQNTINPASPNDPFNVQQATTYMNLLIKL